MLNRIILLATRGGTEQKITKLFNLSILTNGKNPKFTEWLFKIKIKLKINQDHYTLEKLKMVYIKNKIEGNAVRYFTPRLKKEEN